MASLTPLVRVSFGSRIGVIELQDGTTVEVDSSMWYSWLRKNTSFRFESGIAGDNSFTARKHQRQSGGFWYAYRKVDGKLRNVYIGKSEGLTVEKMLEVALKLSQPSEPQVEVRDNKSYAQKCITSEYSNQQVKALKAELEQLRLERDQLDQEVDKLHAKVGDLDLELTNLKEQLQQRADYEAIRDRALARLKLGRQASEYKRAKKHMDLLLAELSGSDF